MMFARGVRRLFTTLAIAWAVVAGLTFLLSPKDAHAGEEFTNIVIEVALLYGVGWIITFLGRGFRKPRGKIIDL